MGTARNSKPEYTRRQGQFLAFIYYYTKRNGCPPAEEDMVRYFKITAPSAHRMVVALEQRRLIERVPGQGRSIRLASHADKADRFKCAAQPEDVFTAPRHASHPNRRASRT